MQYLLSGVLLVLVPSVLAFAWILWRELQPVQRENSPIRVAEYIADVGTQCRDLADACPDEWTKSVLENLSLDLAAKVSELQSNFVDDVTPPATRAASARLALWPLSVEATLMIVAETTVIMLAIDYWLDLPPTSVVLAYFVPIVFVASRYGFVPAIIALVASALLAAFIFYPPRFSFYVSDRTQLIELLAFSAIMLLSIQVIAITKNNPTKQSTG